MNRLQSRTRPLEPSRVSTTLAPEGASVSLPHDRKRGNASFRQSQHVGLAAPNAKGKKHSQKSSSTEFFRHEVKSTDKVEYIHPDMRILLGLNFSKFPSIDRYGKYLLRSLATPVVQLFAHFSLNAKGKNLCSQHFLTSANFLLSLDRETDLAVTFIKYHVQTWFQKGNKDLVGIYSDPVPNKLPPELVGKKLFSGLLNDLIKRLIARSRDGNVAALAVLTSFHLCKLGWDSLCPSHAIETLLSHQENYSLEPPLLPEDSLQAISEVSEAIVSVRSDKPMTKMWPTPSASYEVPRSAGGNFGALLSPGKNGELSARENVLDSIDSQMGILRGVSTVTDGLKAEFFKNSGSALKEARESDGKLHAKVQVIQEPGKERIITAGNFGLTHLQPLQGFLLECWKETPFSTMSANWFESLSSSISSLPPDWVMVSGDYDSATDKLNIRATKASIDAILDALEIDVDHGLYPESTVLHYDVPAELKSSLSQRGKELASKLRQTILQQNGQLMGHPLSFPLLCYINLAGVTLALRRSGLSPDDKHRVLQSLRINGDDIFFLSPPSFVPIWKQATSEVGFTLSRGKSYVSTSFGMINNVFFRRNDQGVHRFGFLNQRLMYNHSLKKGDNEESPIWIGRAFNEMFELAPHSAKFLSDCSHNRKRGFLIKGFTPNFFIPCRLGGLGVDPKYASSRLDGVIDGKFRFTRDQRSFAALLIERSELSVLYKNGTIRDSPKTQSFIRRLGRVSNAINSVSNYPDRVALERLDELPFSDVLPVPGTEEAEENFKGWMGLITSLNVKRADPSVGLNDLRSSIARADFNPFPSRTGTEKRINIKKLKQGVTPLGAKKLMAYSLNPRLLEQLRQTFPLLPPIPRTFSAVYPVRKNPSSLIRDPQISNQIFFKRPDRLRSTLFSLPSRVQQSRSISALVRTSRPIFRLATAGTRWADTVGENESEDDESKRDSDEELDYSEEVLIGMEFDHAASGRRISRHLTARESKKLKGPKRFGAYRSFM